MSAKEIIRQYEELRREYSEYRAEARACGHEVESFEEWAGTTNPKAEAQDRINEMYANDTWDLY